MKIRFLKITQIELDNTVDYYNGERAGLGYEFLWEVFAAIDRIKAFPEAWQSFLAGTRRCLVRRFPYGVVYKEIDDLVLIVAIANLHRKPDYWINRLTEKHP
jgi:hypothetical protein